MPIIVEKISNPNDLNDNDRAYLLKVYKHAPNSIFSEAGVDSAEALINQTLEAPQKCLYAARFNSNYIAAAIVDNSCSPAQLSAICVRELTRRRGVGQQMLIEICKQVGSPLSVLAPTDNTALLATLEKAGFEKTGTDESGTPLFIKA